MAHCDNRVKTKTVNILKKTIDHLLNERPDNSTEILNHYLTEGAKIQRGGRRNTIRASLTNQKQPYNLSNLEPSIVSENQSSSDVVKLFVSLKDSERESSGNNGEDEETEIPVPNLLHWNFYFEKAGVGLGNEETFRVMLSLKQLALEYPVSVVRFWGKVFGIQKNYIIAEVEFREGEGGDSDEDDDDANVDSKNFMYEEENEMEYIEDGSASSSQDDFLLPQSNWRPPLDIPSEEHQTGANKKSYFVVNDIGETWVRLPHVTPKQIVASRNIRKMFTGVLTHEVLTSPPFPGNESCYLRAVIARISATTQVSPLGYFHFPDDGEEMEESNEENREFMLNPEFKGLTKRKLMDRSFNNWVHHTDYLLPQGTCTWYDFQQSDNDFEELGEEFGEEKSPDLIEPEVGPQLLTSLSQDKGIGGVPAWSVNLSSNLMTTSAVVVLRSNIWPGAITVTSGSLFENVYFGWGLKYSCTDFSPSILRACFAEYIHDEEIEECDEPTIEMEQEFQDRMNIVRAVEDDPISDETEEDD